MTPEEAPDAWKRAVVVFWDPEGARWQDILKPGFRHVFACIDDGRQWLMFDARDGRPILKSLGVTSEYDLASFYDGEDGMTVAVVNERGPQVRVPFVLSNCVGLVKAALSIRAPWAFTPYQLYTHLKGLSYVQTNGCWILQPQPASASSGSGY